VINFTTVACRISSWLKWYNNYKNWLRLAKVILKNKMSRFLWFSVYICTVRFIVSCLSLLNIFAHSKLFGFQAARVSINICICISVSCSLKAKFHYTSWFEAGSSWNLAYHLSHTHILCVCVCVCVCVSARISPEPYAQSLPNFLCMLLMSVARSSSGMLTIGHIGYRRKGSDGSAQRGRSVGLIYDCLVRPTLVLPPM